MAITIGAQAYSLTKKNQDNYGSVWMDNTTVPGTEVKMSIKHAYEGKPKSTASGSGYVQTQMERHIVDLTVTVTDANGFMKVTQCYTHIRNLRGSTVGAVGDVAQALMTYVNANADALVAWDN
jgi:cysteine synthase